MDWNKVIDSLLETGHRDAEMANARPPNGYVNPWREKTAERLKINANVCLSLAGALREGLRK
jgi:hypothetical protein